MECWSYLVKLIHSDRFWNIASSVSNSLMVVGTFWLLFYTIFSDRNRKKREVCGLVVAPLAKDLDKVMELLKSSPRIHGGQEIVNIWHWEKIKFDTYSIIYSLDKELFQRIEEYDKEIIKFANFVQQQHEVFADVIREEFQEMLREKVEKVGVSAELRNPDVVAYDACCRLIMGGKWFYVTFLQLIFAEQTWQEYFDDLKREPS